METPYFKVKKLNKDAILPSKRVEDACYDLYAIHEELPKFLYPNQIYMISLGISVEFPANWVFYIVERSSTGSIGLSTRAGVIDSGYRGEIKTPLNNTSDNLIIFTNKSKEDIIKEHSEQIKGYEDKIITLPDKKAIAQGFLLYCPHVDIEETKDLDNNSQRKDDGFGSTDN